MKVIIKYIEDRDPEQLDSVLKIIQATILNLGDAIEYVHSLKASMEDRWLIGFWIKVRIDNQETIKDRDFPYGGDHDQVGQEMAATVFGLIKAAAEDMQTRGNEVLTNLTSFHGD